MEICTRDNHSRFGLSYQLDTELKLIGCNHAFASLAGFNHSEELLGKVFLSLPLFNGCDVLFEKHQTSLNEVMSTRCDITLEEDVPSVSQLPAKYFSHKSPLYAQGDLAGVSVVSICKEKIYSEEKIVLDNILSNIDAHIYWKDLDGVYLGCNDKQARSLGLKHGREVVGKTDFELNWAPETAMEFRRNDLKIIKNKRSMISEETALLDDEKHIMFSVKAPLTRKDQVVGVLGISIDITDKKAMAEKLAVQNKELEHVLARYKAFVLNQEHDIRTPVSSVVGLASALLERLTDPENIEYAHHLHESAKAQKAYLNSLVDSLYLFNDETEVYRRRFDITELLAQVQNMFLCTFKEKALNVTLSFIENMPTILVGDWFRLQQVLICLLSNATKFTENGGSITLRAAVKKIEGRNALLMLDVEDTGVGIDQKALDTIFEPFVRLTLQRFPYKMSHV